MSGCEEFVPPASGADQCVECGDPEWVHRRARRERESERVARLAALRGDEVPSGYDPCFWGFHRANLHVYEKFLELALMVCRSGRERWSARSILHRLRWFAYFETDDPNFGSDFKINDHYSPGYARLLMEREPELVGFFETRVSVKLGEVPGDRDPDRQAPIAPPPADPPPPPPSDPPPPSTADPMLF